MAVSAKIVFDISNFNGNIDGSPSANDIDKIEIHKRIGPESGGGSFVVATTITSGISGHRMVAKQRLKLILKRSKTTM